MITLIAEFPREEGDNVRVEEAIKCAFSVCDTKVKIRLEHLDRGALVFAYSTHRVKPFDLYNVLSTTEQFLRDKMQDNSISLFIKNL